MRAGAELRLAFVWDSLLRIGEAGGMAKNKTKPTKLSVAAFIEALTDETKRADANALIKLVQNATGEKPAMWAPRPEPATTPVSCTDDVAVPPMPGGVCRNERAVHERESRIRPVFLLSAL